MNYRDDGNVSPSNLPPPTTTTDHYPLPTKKSSTINQALSPSPTKLPFQKPSMKRKDPNSTREREIIQQMENRELAKALQAQQQQQEQQQQQQQQQSDMSSIDSDSLIFSDNGSSINSNSLSPSASLPLHSSSHNKINSNTNSKRITKSQKSKRKEYDLHGIDDDDISLASLISEMSLDDLMNFDSYSDKQRVHSHQHNSKKVNKKQRNKVSARRAPNERHNDCDCLPNYVIHFTTPPHPTPLHSTHHTQNLQMSTDPSGWSKMYPYNSPATENIRLIAENVAFNDPIARPGAHTAHEGLRSRGGMALESAVKLGQASTNAMDMSSMLSVAPKLPEIDSHVSSHNLHLEAITRGLRESKGLKQSSLYLTATSKRKRILDDESSVASLTTAGGAGAESKPDNHGGFSRKDIRLVVKFIDTLGDGANAGDGLIDVGELEHAFRQGRRVRATAVSDKDGMLLATRFDEMLGENFVSLSDWFRSCDTSGAGKGDGRLGVLEIKAGVKKLGDRCMPKQSWSEAELISLTRFLDPNGDGDLDLDEFSSGIKRAKEPPAALNFQRKAGKIMGRLEVSERSERAFWKTIMRAASESEQQAKRSEQQAKRASCWLASLTAR